ncbi:acetolactate decarboxylase, partial [Candidatus Sumerlaeota bacterium]|nr:acetolactate decarboxylase [Candidatus Sumerlaeota bacterium]
MVKYRTLALVAFVAFAAGCARTGINRDTIYQVSIVRALQESVFDGEVTYGQLKRCANLGIGAVERMDGELVFVDGACYQVKADGSVHVLKDTEKTPYAVATHFEPDLTVPIQDEI